jgi:hypothetical protein
MKIKIYILTAQWNLIIVIIYKIIFLYYIKLLYSVIWENMGFNKFELYNRQFLTYLLTLFALGSSFVAIMYCLNL